jgi:hypothetical protein
MLRLIRFDCGALDPGPAARSQPSVEVARKHADPARADLDQRGGLSSHNEPIEVALGTAEPPRDLLLVKDPVFRDFGRLGHDVLLSVDDRTTYALLRAKRGESKSRFSPVFPNSMRVHGKVLFSHL